MHTAVMGDLNTAAALPARCALQALQKAFRLPSSISTPAVTSLTTRRTPTHGFTHFSNESPQIQ